MKVNESKRRAEVAPNDRQAPTAVSVKEAEVRDTAPLPAEDKARYEMIATAAYYLAARRGFAAGCELDDWLRAEAQIAVTLLTPRAQAAAQGLGDK